MPQYTFKCEQCGEYDVWKSMNDNLASDECPGCSGESSRVFTLFNVSRMDSKIVKRIDEGMKPKVVKRDQLPQSNIRKKETNPRPWMI
ncbi:FmdB family zinc ribbon protein [Lacicoccus qingdaonensis]|uniref:Putative regulatory protein, FmdB family n=1 Tax=Lacicoccus qingdaonensis TaxID=576118 RepID=A0A1G9FQV2_9BACL|nr:zinc ribbon domain-containing protein [Salinicoccus qingdaonensis]SDK90523.1 putative regulatory protein, FmdB family [Salinicoccus qingdaonensis]